jgi:hypothetical protein
MAQACVTFVLCQVSPSLGSCRLSPYIAGSRNRGERGKESQTFNCGRIEARHERLALPRFSLIFFDFAKPA